MGALHTTFLARSEPSPALQVLGSGVHLTYPMVLPWQGEMENAGSLGLCFFDIFTMSLSTVGIMSDVTFGCRQPLCLAA